MANKSKAQQEAERRQYMEAKRLEQERLEKAQNKKMWQIVIAAVAMIVLIVAISLAIALGGEKGGDTVTTKAPAATQAPNTNALTAPKMESLNMTEVTDFSRFSETSEKTDHVLLNISYTDAQGIPQTGNVVVRLYADVAPKTVENFQKLVADGFYTNVPFHRIMKGFMIQGGDPNGDGISSADEENIYGEFTSNGWTNHLKHVRGVISMARMGHNNNSGSTQFFIMHQTTESLDGDYASFGYVVYGMDTVDGIANTEVNASNPNSPKPIHDVTLNYARFVTLAA